MLPQQRSNSAPDLNLKFDRTQLTEFQRLAVNHQNVVGMPFESLSAHSVPAGLYFYLVSHKIGLTIDRAIVALILIERIVGKANEKPQDTRFGENIKSDYLQFEHHGLAVTPFTAHR
jgi:hypothetical protein